MMTLPKLDVISPGQFSDANCAFMFAMGFEDRALAIAQIAASTQTVKTVVGIKYGLD